MIDRDFQNRAGIASVGLFRVFHAASEIASGNPAFDKGIDLILRRVKPFWKLVPAFTTP